MLATVINVILVLLGSALGLIFKNRISARFSSGLMFALGLCVLGIGISNMIRTNDTLCVIICMVLGTLLGEGLNIEKRMDGLGGVLRRKLIRGEGNNRFVEGFVNASVLFCVGAMAIMGALDSGLTGDHATLYAKSTLDGITSIIYGSTMGAGVALSGVAVFLYQGLITLCASFIAPFLSDVVIAEMKCVGSLLIIGLSFNMLGLTKERLRVGNMLPAMLVPCAYFPIAEWLGRLF